MMHLLLKFAAVCRSGNLRVSTSEVIDAMTHLQWIDFSDEAGFKAALKANFAKSRRDQDNFDRLYHLFFHEMQTSIALDPNDGQNDELRQIIAKLRENKDLHEPVDQALIDFLQGDPAAFLQEMYNLENREEYRSPALKSNLGQLSGRLAVMLRINAMKGAIGQASTGSGANPSGGPSAERLLDRLDRAYKMLTEDNRPNNDALKKVRSNETHFKDIGERSFAALSPAEILQMQEIIKKLVRKLRDRMGRRYAAGSRRYLDVKKTLRHSGRFQGIPIEIKYRQRPLKKAKIVALCDVSGSVWSAARFMLNMLYSMQDCFSAVHSFAFISATTDITEIFEKHEADRAVEKVLSSRKIEFGALTDYGEVFQQFRRNHMHLVNKRTTVIIVGDGRSNYHNPREEILADIREKCRRIIWLNPEPEDFWHTGDSEINTYKAYCHELRPCRNLNQLVDFVEDLVL
ncbi:MAG: vWA domain-containing protein [Thermodesulfobacteriota bacterium]